MPRTHKNSDSSDAEDFDNGEFKKMLGKIFPSKHMKKEIEKMDKIDKKVGNKKSKRASSDEDYVPPSSADESDSEYSSSESIDSE
jgi:hypothetical protein